MAILCAPIFVWGHLIGPDILGYAIMLCAFASFRKNKAVFLALCILATLTRFQYCFLFAGLFMDRQTVKYEIVGIIIGISLCLFCGLSGGSRFTIPANYVAKSGDICLSEFERINNGKHNFYNKPERISHSMWFDKNLDSLGAHESMANPLIIVWNNRVEFIKLTGSKIYDAFRFHQIIILLFLLAIPVSRIRFIVSLCILHYIEIILLSSLYFQRYTFMIEISIVSCVILLYDMITSDIVEE